MNTSSEFLSQLPFHLKDAELGIISPDFRRLIAFPQEPEQILALEYLMFEWSDKVERLTDLSGKNLSSAERAHIYTCALFSSGQLQALVVRVSLHRDNPLYFVEMFASSQDEWRERQQSFVELFNHYLQRLEHTQEFECSNLPERTLAKKCRKVFGKPRRDLSKMSPTGISGIITPLPKTARLS